VPRWPDVAQAWFKALVLLILIFHYSSLLTVLN
jgi:hypothetical protein